MGSTGFEIQFSSTKEEELDEETWADLWSSALEIIQDWLESKLKKEEEQGLLEGIEELIEWIDNEPTDGKLPFYFNDYDVVGEAAGYHWFRTAILAERKKLEKLFKPHSFTLDFSELENEMDNTILAYFDDEVYLVYPDEDEVGCIDGAISINDLDPDAKKEIDRVKKINQCQCSLCRKSKI
ncbi:MAG: hypothetical protein OEZ34_09255 [Spirochaetia bacterium]|nr:hypothetical protein [Spirochaetia bacterium]